ncbi:MAG: serine/threonine protein phosphatase [Ruminococcaceae bacterium]|nr:serine/threonine protein phosphatase [Oscillospiraceae bacterium]
MTYVMSDIHGQYEKFLKMLKIIRFKDTDDLYILGDVVDRGPQSVELLRDISMRHNVFPILGNHDMTALMLLRKLCTEVTEDNCENTLNAELLKSLAMWQADGGQATLDGFKRLPPDERSDLLDYLEDFSPYEIVTVGDKRFILVHGGIPYAKRSLPLSKQDIGEMVTERPDYSKRYYKNAYLVTGHTPTASIDEKYKGKIYQGNGHIAIDCGAGFGMNLGCFRLEDSWEYYV